MRKVRSNEKSETKRGTAIFFAVLRIIAAAVCAFLLYTFVYTMSLRQINYGNIIGVLYCLSVIIAVIVYPFLRKNRRLRNFTRACGAVMLVFAIYCGIISCLIASEMIHGDERAAAVSASGEETPQTVIVLGCQVIDGEPSPMLALRLGKAEEYLRAHPSAVCVVTGGMGIDEEISEAECMYRYLIRAGIDADRIYKEDRSTDTTENLRFTTEIIEAEGLPQDVVVVSECYHIYRGVRQAKLNGLHAAGICPSSDPVIITLPSYWLREIFAVTRDLLFA